MKNYHFPRSIKRNYTTFAKIIDTYAYLPDKIITNNDIIASTGLKVTDQAIQKTVGVKERRQAAVGKSDSDLLLQAATGCLSQAGIEASQLSKIIVNKFVGDKLLPMTASMLQAKLHCPMAVQSFDIDGGMNSFLQSFEIAANMINCGDKYILIVSGGIINPFININDARHQFLFGDAATALLLGPSKKRHILATYQFSNYDYIEKAIGFQVRKNTKQNCHITRRQELSDLYKIEDWTNTIPFIKMALKQTVDSLVEQANTTRNEIDLLLVTEYNQNIRDAIIESSGISKNKSLSILHKYGNTLSASLPLLIQEAKSGNRLKKDTLIMMLSLGEGISGGGILYNC
ncbi:MAG: hypothetical protein JXR70_10365 [Spirochaetales bacterium]|nr:hypothetical protein [Spirochaetales bacterium]